MRSFFLLSIRTSRCGEIFLSVPQKSVTWEPKTRPKIRQNVTIHGVKCLVLQSHDLHAGRLQQSPSSYQDDHERCAAFRPARLHFLRLFYLTLTRSRGTAPLPLPDSHPSAVSMHSSRSIHFSCMSPRSSAVLRSTAHTQRFQTDRIPSSCSLRL